MFSICKTTILQLQWQYYQLPVCCTLLVRYTGTCFSSRQFLLLVKYLFNSPFYFVLKYLTGKNFWSKKTPRCPESFLTGQFPNWTVCRLDSSQFPDRQVACGPHKTFLKILLSILWTLMSLRLTFREI